MAAPTRTGQNSESANLLMPDVTDPRERAFVRLVFTVDAQRYDSVIDDFQEFLRSVRAKNAD